MNAKQGDVPLWQPLKGASPADAFGRFWRKYATFSGRASRSEFWWWFLIDIVIGVVLSIVVTVLDHVSPASFGFITYIWGLVIIVPWLALLWRRLHDANLSGWWALSPFVLLVIGGILFVIRAVTLIIAHGHSAAGVGELIAGGVVDFLSTIILLILTLLPSNGNGARFDRPPQGWVRE